VLAGGRVVDGSDGDGDGGRWTAVLQRAPAAGHETSARYAATETEEHTTREHVVQFTIFLLYLCLDVKLNERKKSEELRELLGLEQVSLVIKKSMLRWFGYVERKYDNDWVKRCIT